ncbi:MAG: glycosyltransferase family 2 protein [Calditrichaeota bacterium]|jgi:glycosyltransferase involved in cell wall biosynthesis|nr:glycosyltransferase family 2 protein [Calditrichota bacterium]MBT7617381.1 glycosyltransferase family 2 protein [Calditrichota bacterium]MBT7789468.1 glycosyltransferase family 2 protein [Calditrichota bacterium]
MEDSKVAISVVIPFLNEEGSLPELYKRLTEVLSGMDLHYELLFVDDGSTDDSNKIVKEFRSHDRTVRLFTFRRNQGKSAALSVGFQAAVGNYVVTMDADLQDDPAEIPNLISNLETGFDLVSGWKKIRHDPITKTLPSKVFNGVVGFFSGINLHDFNCGLKIYRNEVVKELTVYGERHRFLPVLAHMQGFKVGETPVEHHARLHGKTKFGAYRFIAGFFDLITLLFRMKFVTKPMHLFGSLGFLSLISGMSIITYLMIGWFNGIWIGNRPLFLIGILGVITGVQLFTLGLLAEMIVERTHREKLSLRNDSDSLNPSSGK